MHDWASACTFDPTSMYGICPMYICISIVWTLLGVRSSLCIFHFAIPIFSVSLSFVVFAQADARKWEMSALFEPFCLFQMHLSNNFNPIMSDGVLESPCRASEFYCIYLDSYWMDWLQVWRMALYRRVHAADDFGCCPVSTSCFVGLDHFILLNAF